MQHDYFHSFYQSDHGFLASSLPLPSSLLKLPIAVKDETLVRTSSLTLILRDHQIYKFTFNLKECSTLRGAVIIINQRGSRYSSFYCHSSVLYDQGMTTFNFVEIA